MKFLGAEKIETKTNKGRQIKEGKKRKTIRNQT
jgi:hypothetical protein